MTDPILISLTGLISGGSLVIYDGNRPASANAPEESEPLAILLFQSPAFDVDGDSAVARQIPATKGLRNGMAQWYRVYGYGGHKVIMDGSVSAKPQDIYHKTNVLVMCENRVYKDGPVQISSFVLGRF